MFPPACCTAGADRISEGGGAFVSNTNVGSQTSKGLQISEALQLQIEVERRLHEQLEVKERILYESTFAHGQMCQAALCPAWIDDDQAQRHLQLRIEAHGKYLQSVLEKAQETLGKNLGSAGLEAAKVQLPELVSKVSTECLSSSLSEMKEMPDFCTQQISERDYDIEVLTGNEKECIEMNLVLGVADLHTPEAVVGAESAMAGSRLIHPSTICSDSSDSEDSDVDDNEETSCLKGKDHEQNAGGKDTSISNQCRKNQDAFSSRRCESKMALWRGVVIYRSCEIGNSLMVAVAELCL
ncbi:hypothetical protein ACLOJK_007571 [Asimina triloba]